MRKILLIAALAILIPILVFGFLGCMKKPETKPDYGPEVSLDQINKAVSESTPVAPLSIKKGQFVSLDFTQVIDTQGITTLAQRSDEVMASDDAGTEINWTFQVNMREFFPDGTSKSTKQDYKLAFQKNQTASVTQTSSSSDEVQKFSSPVSLMSLKKADAAVPAKVTYHNLTQESGVLREGSCIGALCRNGLRYLKVNFDRVIWENEERGMKTKFSVVYSPDVPTYISDWAIPEEMYLSNQVQFCTQTWIEVSNGDQKQSVPVKQCSEMRDFQFGT
jgi:hypothetical protein